MKRGAVRLAVIGAGRIGRLHIENLVERIDGAEVLWVVDVNRATAETTAVRFGIAGVSADPSEALADPRVDGVLVCSSTDTHADLVQAAAEHGKHVFCEKPIALELETIDALCRRVAAAGVVLGVGFNRRFDPAFRQVREAVVSGRIGAVEMLRITSRDPQPPPLAYIEASGGLFLDMTIHDFDMARFLMGKEVCEVFARGSALVDPAIGRAGDVDTATVSLRFAGGALGVIDNSRRAVYGYDQRVEILGARGMVRADNPPAHSAAVWDENGAHAAALKHFFIARYARAYVAEMEAFCRAVANQEPFPVDGKDGRRAVMLAHAAQRSLVERRPVAIEEMT